MGYVRDEGDHLGDEQSINIDNVGEYSLREIRTATSGGDEGVELAKEVEQGNLARRDVQEVKKQVQRGKTVDEAVESVKEVNRGPAKKTYSVTVSGVLRVKLEECAGVLSLPGSMVGDVDIVRNERHPEGAKVAVERKDVFDAAFVCEDGGEVIDQRDLLVIVPLELVTGSHELLFAPRRGRDRVRSRSGSG